MKRFSIEDLNELKRLTGCNVALDYNYSLSIIHSDHSGNVCYINMRNGFCFNMCFDYDYRIAEIAEQWYRSLK